MIEGQLQDAAFTVEQVDRDMRVPLSPSSMAPVSCRIPSRPRVPCSRATGR